jgi:hypothetical protein
MNALLLDLLHGLLYPVRRYAISARRRRRGEGRVQFLAEYLWAYNRPRIYMP